jgi:hypothetical protein
MATHVARTQPRPDWALWLTIETVSIRDLAFLSLDKEPDASLILTPGDDVHARIKVLLEHVEKGSTILRRPYGKHRRVAPETTHLTVDSFRRWAHSVGWDVPPELQLHGDGDEQDGSGVVPASVQQEPAKPVSRSLAQERAILGRFQELGHDPMRLPKAAPGKSSPPVARVRAELGYPRDVMQKAMRRLVVAGQAAYIDTPAG